jgi:hypothetical protein
MTPRAPWLWIALVAGVGALAFAQPAPRPSTPKDKGSHFDHRDHLTRGLKLAPCTQCHPMADTGLPMPPAALGHFPCLSAGCHATYFVPSAAARAKDPTLDARATAFCLGCHDTPDGKSPTPASKPPWNTALKSYEAEREWHVEMPHYDHVAKGSERTDCKSCHVTGDARAASPWALVPGTPGHAQCGVCHDANDPVLKMDQCEHCHKQGARAAYLGKSRAGVDVRACDSEGYAKYLADSVARHEPPPPCFKHEREAHRIVFKNGKPVVDGARKPVEVECMTCHYMVGDKARWGGHRYDSLADLHKSPIIDNRQNEEHASCSSGGACHTADLANNKCTTCHVERNAF